MTKTEKKPKVKKPQGPIRWEAILPFSLIVLLIGLYFHFFFDLHLRKALEWGGYQAVGAEVNIGNLETSFLKASLRIQKIEITDAERPTHNSAQIGDVRFSMLWDALLRAKVVVNEAVVEQIEFGTQRKRPGKVKPLEPEKEGDALSEKVKGAVLSKAESEFGGNVLGDAIALLGGTDANEQLKKLEQSLPSKEMLTKFESDLKAKQKEWDARIKSLPQEKEIRALDERIKKVKVKDFKTPQEVQASLQELDSIYKDADSKYKQIQSVSNDINPELKGLESSYRNIEKQIQTDIKSLEQHFRIPQLDPKALAQSVFRDYLAPYEAKFFRYKAMVDKYIPPKFKTKGEKEEEVPIQPHPREDGISYEFARTNSYPLFWIKKTGISSQAGLTPDAGNIKGEITDITSHQSLVGKPTVATIAGDFPSKEIVGLFMKLSLDNRKELSEVLYNLKLASYPILGRDLINSPDVKISFAKASGSMGIEGKLVGLKNVIIAMENSFNKIDYSITAKNEIADQILKSVFAGIPTVNLTVKGQGTLPTVPLSINSNLGPELAKGFQKQLQAKVNEARQKIEAYVNDQVGQQKAQIEKQLNQLRAQFDQEVKKAQTQLDAEKKKIESRADQAKKDLENQGKKKLEQEGKKAVDDLKKKLGW